MCICNVCWYGQLTQTNRLNVGRKKAAAYLYWNTENPNSFKLTRVKTTNTCAYINTHAALSIYQQGMGSARAERSIFTTLNTREAVKIELSSHYVMRWIEKAAMKCECVNMRQYVEQQLHVVAVQVVATRVQC